MATNEPGLMPLRMQAGWGVTYNKFRDVEPLPGKDDELLENWGYFTEDILQINRLGLQDGDWQVREPATIIDLGWYPDGSPAGQYRLELVVDGDWAEPADVYESRDRCAIAAKIEEWMMRDHGA